MRVRLGLGLALGLGPAHGARMPAAMIFSAMNWRLERRGAHAATGTTTASAATSPG